MKKISITIFSLIFGLFLVFAVGCSEKPTVDPTDNPTEMVEKVELVAFEDLSLEAKYNDTFDISEYLTVKDSDGNSYQATASVYDSSFKKIEITDNSFTLQSLQYTVKLKVAISQSQTEIRVITISVLDDSPYEIEFSKASLPVWGVNCEFVLPTAVGVRQVSGETNDATLKVFFDGTTKEEQTVENGKFRPLKVGRYIIQASIVDEDNAEKVYTDSLALEVLEEMPKILEDFSASAENVKSAPNFNENNGDLGVYLESYTDKDGITQYGIGKATMQHNGKTNGYIAVRFNKTKDELKSIMGNIESITFRLIVKDADFADGAEYPIKIFNIFDRTVNINQWTEITLTRAEIFNAELVEYFGSEQAFIEEDRYGFASGFASNGLGYLRKNNGTVYRLLHCNAYAGKPTEVYIDEIFYDTASLEGFNANANNIKSSSSFTGEGDAQWLSNYTDKNGATYYGVGKADIQSNTNAIALRFKKTKDELESIMHSIDTITFRILVQDGDLQDGDSVPLKFFGETLQDKTKNPIVNEWTTVTLTRAEILNETLKAGFDSEAEAIGAFAAAYCVEGTGLTVDGTNNVTVLAYQTGETATEVYIDEITYKKKITLVDFIDETVEADLNKAFSLKNYLTVKDYDGKSYKATAQVFDSQNAPVAIKDNGFIPYMKSAYTVEISVDLPDGTNQSRTITVYADNNLETFNGNAENIKSAHNFNANNGDLGVYLESYTDKNGVTEYGIGKATMQFNGGSSGYIALRFDRTKEQLKAIFNDGDFESITFRVLITDNDFADGALYPLSFFNLIEKTAKVNEWTDITLTKEEIFNATLVGYFGNAQELINAEPYGFAGAFASDGLGYLRKGSGTVYRMLYSNAYGGQSATDVYIDDIKYTMKKGLVDFADIFVDSKLNEEFSFEKYLTVRDTDGVAYVPSVKVYNAQGQEVSTADNKFIPVEAKYTIQISVTMDNVVKTRTITLKASHYLETFNSNAENIKSAPNFNANNGEFGVHLESYTDKDGVTESGVGKATMQNNGGGSGFIALRFDKSKEQLKEIMQNVETITFRVLVTDADFANGADYTLSFFNLVDKTAYVNQWTDITLTREEIFNATLIEYFGNEQEMIESEPYGFANAFASNGLGYLRKGSGTVYRMLFSKNYGGNFATDVYITSIAYTLSSAD